MIPSNSSASAAALQADVENSNSSELSSVQNDSVKMPDDAENAEGGSQTSDDIGKEAKKKNTCLISYFHVMYLFTL